MANATILYACTPEGLIILTRPGTLPQWLPPRRVLEGKSVASAWAEPGPPIRVLAAASGSLIVSENGGRSWADVEMPAPVTSIFDFGNPPILIAVMQGGQLATSHDSGAMWEVLPALPERGNVRSFCASDSRVYLVLEQGGETALLAGNPRAGEWSTLASGEMITAVACDSTVGSLYAGFTDGVRVSKDDGMAWTTLAGSPTACTAIAVLPGVAGKSPTLVVGTDLGLRVSQDGGAAWQEADLGEAGGVITLARDPERRDRLYAATTTGYLFESGNRGQSWERINPSPLPPASYLYVLRI
jgi:hypothetical protein